MTAAGRGDRFKSAYDVPKPFVPVDGVPMWKRALEPWMRYGMPTIIMQEEHEKFIDDDTLLEMNFIFLGGYTEGAAETCSIGARGLDPKEPVVFVECDSVIEFDHDSWDTSTSGTFVVERDNPAHSYCQLDDQGYVTEIREKEVISNWANTGHYWFESCEKFLEVFDDAYKHKRKTRGEYYTAPLYNDLIANGDKVKTVLVDEWHCWGTPDDVSEWESRCTN